MKQKNDYAIYKGDEFIDLGPVDYLAKKLNVKESTIYFLASGVNKRRIEKRKCDNALLAIKLEKDD